MKMIFYCSQPRTSHVKFLPDGLARLAICFAAAVAILLATAEVHGKQNNIQQLIQKAGNADSDSERLDYLKQINLMPDLEKSVKSDVDKLIIQVQRWIDDKRLPYFGREVRRKRDYDFGIDANSPIYPLTWLYRGRMIVWFTIESGSVNNVPERKREFLDAAKAFFEKTAEAFPENNIARMYLGVPIPPKKHYRAVPGAPEWAVYQREGLERLADIIEWWIDNRMQASAEYGGGWGDDCEMWRWWVPVLIGFDSPKITAAQARFSEAILSQPHMKLGYTTRMSDVEHTAEDSADAVTPMMHIDPENDIWRHRALRFAELMEEKWVGRNERGLLQFKSTYFTAEKVDPSPARACDTTYHARVVQPTLLYWQRTGDEKLTKLFSSWMDTWVDAAARTDRGKPAGILPTAIHWPDGQIGGTGPNWWDPRNHSEPTLYRFPSAMGLMTHTLLLTHYITGERKYLEPLFSMAKIRLRYLKSKPEDAPPGSRAWCAARLGALSSVITKYRFLTGDSEFDELLAKERLPYVGLRLRGDMKPLVSSLRHNAEALRVNFEGYTSEVRYTDRVLRFPSLFDADGILGRPVPSIRRPNPSLLYSTSTGDPGTAGYFPLNAVRWLSRPRDIAALVTSSGKERLIAELFHFGKRSRPMSAELYLLSPGKYELTLWSQDDQGKEPLTTEQFEVTSRRTRVSFVLPSQKLCVLRITRHRAK